MGVKHTARDKWGWAHKATEVRWDADGGVRLQLSIDYAQQAKEAERGKEWLVHVLREENWLMSEEMW